jgi:response regulator RpfG family c-di-GMP phosphodiesterase
VPKAPDTAAEGSVRALTEVLALASPESYARGMRLRRLAGELLLAAGLERAWHIETAALMSTLGGVAAPRSLRALDDTEQGPERMRELTARLPEIADAILAPIPQLEDVRAAILSQRVRFDGCTPSDARCGPAIPLGGRVLRLVVDYDDLASGGLAPAQAMAVLKARPGSYDPGLLEALGRVVAVTRQLHLVADPNPLRWGA